MKLISVNPWLWYEANVYKIENIKQKEDKKPVKQQIGASQNKKSQQALLAGVVKRKRYISVCLRHSKNYWIIDLIPPDIPNSCLLEGRKKL